MSKPLTGRKGMNRKPHLLVVLLLTAWFTAGMAFCALAQEAGDTSQAGHQTIQTTCPVRPGNKIDPNIYTDYEGKRVYFCCAGCKAAFEANPEKYLDRLPQFAGRRAEPEGAGRSGFHVGQLVEPFGVATLSLLSITFCLGYFMKKKPKLFLKWHRRLAYVTIVVAFCHATLVLIAHNL